MAPPVGSFRRTAKLSPEVSRILYLRNLPFKITSEELYDIFGKYGSVRQIRKGVGPKTAGTAFVVYDDIYDAKNALENLSGFNVAGRYLVVLYYNPARVNKKLDLEQQQADLDRIKSVMRNGL